MNEHKDLPGLNDELQVPEGLGELSPDKKLRPKLIRIGLGVIALVLMMGLGTLLGNGKQGNRIQDLERENSFLKAKLELYASTVDSIHTLLDSLQIKAESKKDYPYYSGGASTSHSVQLEAPLQRRLHSTDERLVNILQSLSTRTQSTGYRSFIQPASLQNVPGIYPTFGRISDAWGTRMHPITGQLEFHYGLDIANQAGTPIYATAAGKVVKVDYDSGYGKRICIDHGNGYRSLYAHLYNYQVKIGDEVQKGQIIALMGSTGLSTGPHLHYEVQYQEAKVNPANYLNRIEAYASR